MTTTTTIPGYTHTQKGPLCLILYVSALFCFALAEWTTPSEPMLWLAVLCGEKQS